LIFRGTRFELKPVLEALERLRENGERLSGLRW
jgi:hypothetical protein